MMSIKSFVNNFQNCPLCNDNLKIQAYQNFNESLSNKFSILTSNSDITINVISNYFIDPQQETFEFSISFRDGSIKADANIGKFVSLYDLDIFLFKECENCAINKEFFRTEVNISYDRAKTNFAVNKKLEHIIIKNGSKKFTLVNDYITGSSFFGFDNFTTFKKINLVPFDRIDFSSRSKILSKMVAIQLLS